MALVPAELVAAIREVIDQRPQTDVEWQDLQLFASCIFIPAEPLTRDERRHIRGPWSPSPEERQRLRTETEMIRKHFEAHDIK